jgi:hypothetical protein
LTEIIWKVDVIIDSRRKIFRGLFLAGFFLQAWLAISFLRMAEMNALAGREPPKKGAKSEGDVERGRAVFDGNGIFPVAGTRTG